jgi:hypothetical protein
MARLSRWERGVAQIRARGFESTQASVMSGSNEAADGFAMSGGFGGSGLVAEARQYLGTNPTSRGSLWCARFMNMVLEKTGHRGTGSDLAASFAHYGQRVSGPQVGAIAVMSRHGGGHVGIRHRRPGQSDHDLRQQPQPRAGSTGVARSNLRVCDAELSLAALPLPARRGERGSIHGRHSGTVAIRPQVLIRESTSGLTTLVGVPAANATI